MTTDKNKLDKLIINCPPLGNVGAPMGNQNATKHKDEGVKIDKDKIKKSPTGNSREYWIGRLNRPLKKSIFPVFTPKTCSPQQLA
jgi:hypothetical protein